MSILITPTISLVAAQGASAGVVLQPGTVVAAKVLQILGNDQVRIAIAGQAIDVQSQVPLQAGQTLQLAVSQTTDGIALAVVNQQGGAAASQGSTGSASATATSDSVTLGPGAAAGLAGPATTALAAPANPLTPLETVAVSIAAQTAATQQTSLAPLFANLGVAAGLIGLPPQVQQAVAQLLAQRTSLDPGLTGDDIQAGVPEFRAVHGSLAGLRIGASIRHHAGSQGSADRAAPGADDGAGSRPRRRARQPRWRSRQPRQPRRRPQSQPAPGAALPAQKRIAAGCGDCGGLKYRPRHRRRWHRCPVPGSRHPRFRSKTRRWQSRWNSSTAAWRMRSCRRHRRPRMRRRAPPPAAPR